MPAHVFLTLVLEHFGVELVNLVPNSITMLGVFVYLCEAYLGISADLELFQYYYGMTRLAGVTGSCSMKLHNGKSKEYIQMYTTTEKVITDGFLNHLILCVRDDMRLSRRFLNRL